eukprot:gnl/Carplike_NY0171/6204_a8517_209.p1 GENE.gnl/Carplike_NY0171/6204_a8517_209~~gnl/Carplike_NY0171/6204_a8517_209.p1  ORF type:complete len:374 (+),score=79.94 gnl/Carplike_NY0171/6204_a8517_209:125-1123(+)
MANREKQGSQEAGGSKGHTPLKMHGVVVIGVNSHSQKIYWQKQLESLDPSIKTHIVVEQIPSHVFPKLDQAREEQLLKNQMEKWVKEELATQKWKKEKESQAKSRRIGTRDSSRYHDFPHSQVQGFPSISSQTSSILPTDVAMNVICSNYRHKDSSDVVRADSTTPVESTPEVILGSVSSSFTTFAVCEKECVLNHEGKEISQKMIARTKNSIEKQGEQESESSNDTKTRESSCISLSLLCKALEKQFKIVIQEDSVKGIGAVLCSYHPSTRDESALIAREKDEEELSICSAGKIVFQRFGKGRADEITSLVIIGSNRKDRRRIQNIVSDFC